MAETKYSAPALEKGLDILELLASQRRPLTISQISHHLGRSVSELFRMVQVLERRGYLESAARGEGFELSNKLFALGMSRSPTRNLLASALPLMQRLSDQTGQSCHLAVASEGRMVVIARVEAPGDLGFSVRVGRQRPLPHSTSGIVLYAFQPPQTQSEWSDRLSASETVEVWRDFAARAQLARKQGYVLQKSDFVDAVTDISCPIFGDAGVVAALTLPHLQTQTSASVESSLGELRAVAQAISSELGGKA